MKYLLPLIVFLSACSTTVPVKRTFPEADPFMLQPPPSLVQLPADTTELHLLIENSTENYGKFHELVERYLMWQMWYEQQKENFESVK